MKINLLITHYRYKLYDSAVYRLNSNRIQRRRIDCIYRHCLIKIPKFDGYLASFEALVLFPSSLDVNFHQSTESRNRPMKRIDFSLNTALFSPFSTQNTFAHAQSHRTNQNSSNDDIGLPYKTTVEEFLYVEASRRSTLPGIVPQLFKKIVL